MAFICEVWVLPEALSLEQFYLDMSLRDSEGLRERASPPQLKHLPVQINLGDRAVVPHSGVGLPQN